MEQREGWEPFSGCGDWEGDQQAYRAGGDYGVMGHDDRGWLVVFALDGLPAIDRRFDTAEDAMDAAERLAAEVVDREGERCPHCNQLIWEDEGHETCGKDA
jgi:hypothetical protein